MAERTKEEYNKREKMISAIEGYTGVLNVPYHLIDTDDLSKIADAILNDPNKVW